MKPIFKHSCVIALLSILCGCSTATDHPVEKVGMLMIGQTTDEVLKIMGPTPMRDYRDDESLLQWCKTSRPLFRTKAPPPPGGYVDAYFYQDKLVKVLTYDVSKWGDCTDFFNPAEWENPKTRK